MPVYRCKVRGEKKPRIVRADTAAQARGHLVEVDTMTGEEVADEVEKGATIERAGTVEPVEPPAEGSEAKA
jgi:hypothetical protein